MIETNLLNHPPKSPNIGVVTETSSTRFDRLGGVTKLTDDFRTAPDLSPKTTHTKLQTNYGQTNDVTGHQ